MTIIASVVSEAALVAAVIVLFYVLLLTLRSPFRSRWLASEGWDVFAALIVTASVAIAYTTLIMGLISLGMGIWGSLVIATAFHVGIAILFWYLLNISARLKACEEGRSPFAALSHGGSGAGVEQTQ